MVIINMISASYVLVALVHCLIPTHTHLSRFYFVRFLTTPGGSDILVTHARRLATEEMLPQADEHDTVAEMCQFLSTLLALGDPEVVPADVREPLLKKLKAWRTKFRGRFAQETAERCISMLEPSMS